MPLSDNQLDFCSGAALIYMGLEGPVDEYVVRLRKAMETGDDYEAEHITALMVVKLVARDLERHKYLAEWWTKTWKGEDNADLRTV